MIQSERFPGIFEKLSFLYKVTAGIEKVFRRQAKLHLDQSSQICGFIIPVKHGLRNMSRRAVGISIRKVKPGQRIRTCGDRGGSG